jgi:fatty-acyl-CoA synthase
MGRDAVAYVELKPARRSRPKTWWRTASGLLAGYKVPRDMRFEEIPKTSTGKIQKFVLRERARSNHAIE